MIPGLYRRAVVVFGVLAIVLGLAIVAETARAGGGSVGYLFGVLFVALGCGRLYLLLARGEPRDEQRGKGRGK